MPPLPAAVPPSVLLLGLVLVPILVLPFAARLTAVLDETAAIIWVRNVALITWRVAGVACRAAARAKLLGGRQLHRSHLYATLLARDKASQASTPDRDVRHTHIAAGIYVGLRNTWEVS